MKYTTFDKQVIEFDEIDHQHLSNIYWYNKVCLNRTEIALSVINKSLDDKFNGIILPYKPLERFKDEVRFLDERNMLIWNREKTKADVIYKDKIIGIYETDVYKRELKINEILNGK